MINVAIVEDCEADRERVKSCLNFVARQNGEEFAISEFPNALAFFAEFESEYDLIFFDIEMPSMSGMEAARKLRTIDKTVGVVFITNLAKYAVEGYAVDALDFIIKPVNKYDFAMKMQRVIPRVKCGGKDNSIIVKTDGKTVALPVVRILYIEVSGHYVIYHSIDGEFPEYATLKSIEKKINESGAFAKCNRCYIVNLRYVEAINRDSVSVGGDELVITRSQKREFYEAYTEYVAGRRNG